MWALSWSKFSWYTFWFDVQTQAHTHKQHTHMAKISCTNIVVGQAFCLTKQMNMNKNKPKLSETKSNAHTIFITRKKKFCERKAKLKLIKNKLESSLKSSKNVKTFEEK